MADTTLTSILVKPSLPLPQPVQKPAIGSLPVPETAQTEELIGSVLLLIKQREAEIYRVDLQQAEEKLADGKTPTNAHKVRCLAVHFRVHRLGGSIAPVVHRDQVRFGSARKWTNRYPHAGWRVSLDMPGNKIDDGGGILVGYQSTGDLGMRLMGQHRLDPFTLEPAPDTIHF